MSGVIGQRVLRREDFRFLVGAGTYVENLALPGALHATFVRSPFAHARITGIDASAALEIPGTQVYTGADVELETFKPPFPGLEPRMGRPLVAADAVRFNGDIVAVVVSESRLQSRDAADLVAVDYEPLPVVVDPRDALADETILFPEVGTNVCSRKTVDEPDAALFDDCEIVVSGKLVSQRLAACPLEPRSTAVAIGGDGRLTAWLSTQTPHHDRHGLARILGLEESEVRVVGPDVGGGFGAKGLCVEDVLVAWLVRRTERPVRWTESRGENMVAMVHGRGAALDFTIGGRRDGTVLAYRLGILQDAGAYPFLGAFLPNLTALMASGVYAIPKIEVEAVAVVTNTTPTGAFRGAGRPEAAQAIERAMDLFAAEAGLDPAEARRRNFITKEDFPHQTASGAQYDSGDYARALDLVLDAAGYEALRAEQGRRRELGGPRQLGIGLSVYVEITAGLPETEFGAVEITPEGGAILRTGSFSHGQGHETTFAMIVADRLGLPIERVSVVKGDTDEVPRGTGTYGSKSTQLGGTAAAQAAVEVVEHARQLAADVFEAALEDVVLDPETGSFQVAGAPQSSLSWTQLAERAATDGRLEELRVESEFQADSPTFPFGAHVAVVEVDTETGAVELVRLVAVDDAGHIVNPLVAEGQVHGGIATGVAQALYEEVAYDEEGTPLTASFLGYMLPSAAELPSFETVDMETPTPVNVLGAKGIGESGTIGSTPAVQNAVIDALSHLGVRHVEMPANGERVWRALDAARQPS
jgi:aerobic carbon-monoxide dehydrogenase large subunit